MTIRRICMYAAPGAGKSTTAAFLFSEFKRKKFGPSIELVTEYAKEFAWKNTEIKPVDQLYIFTEQLRREQGFLSAGVDLIITDSPLWLSVYYGNRIECPYTEEIQSICRKMDEQYPTMNLFVDRHNRVYDPRGRYHTEAEAKDMDSSIKDFLCTQKLPYEVCRSEEFSSIWATVVDNLIESQVIKVNNSEFN